MANTDDKRVKKILIEPYRPVYPTPAALIASVDAQGKPNLITLSEVFTISIHKPVIVGIAVRKTTYSHGLISIQKEYSVNFPPVSLLSLVDSVGHVSGRECDKFSHFGLTPLPSTFISVPIVAECPVNLECTVLSIQEIGDHDLFLGKVMAEHVDEDKLLNERPDPEKLDMFAFAFREYWSIEKKIATKGFASKSINEESRLPGG